MSYVFSEMARHPRSESYRHKSKTSNPQDKEIKFEFKDEVRPFIETYCYQCHSGDSVEGDVDLDNLIRSPFDSRNIQTWVAIRRVLANQQMPPVDEAQPTKSEVERISGFVRRVLDQADVKLRPDPYVRRLSRVEYENTIRDLLRMSRHCFDNPARIVANDEYFQPAIRQMPDYVMAISYAAYSDRFRYNLQGVSTLPVDPPVEHGFRNDRKSLSVSPLLLESHIEIVGSLMNSDDMPLICGVWNSLFNCPPNLTRDEQIQYATVQLGNFLDRAFRRPTSKQELQPYLELFTNHLSQKQSFVESMKLAVAGILLSPGFLY